MATFDSSAASVPVREDLREAHRRLLEHIRAPGSWWSGAQRVAIAAESRQATSCGLCARRKAALSPTHVEGVHDTLGTLPASGVDVIHRVRTDPGRLSRSWFESIVPAGLSDGEYVELVGVVALTAGLDFFTRVLGILPYPLPDALPGDPSRYRPASARRGTAWVPMIACEDATGGAEADLYEGLAFVPNIVRALSLVPSEVKALERSSAAHYLPVKDIVDPAARRSLDRPQMELIAARVSALNQCFY
jgi:alkylhydroperoxidase family enzyme